jgi:hypothetical protein
MNLRLLSTAFCVFLISACSGDEPAAPEGQAGGGATGPDASDTTSTTSSSTSSASGAGGDAAGGGGEGGGSASETTLEQTAFFKGAAPGVNSLFGWSVAMSGDLLAIGEPADAELGRVYIYHHDGNGWVEEAQLQPDVIDPGDMFGNALALDGDTLVVGAYREASAATGVNGDATDNSATEAGAAYVFRRTASGGWVQEAYLKASNTDADDLFGIDVAVHGSVAAVAAYYEDSDANGVGGDPDDDSAVDSGAVYLFRRQDDGSWAEEAYVKASNSGAGDLFGTSLALDDDVLVVGAYDEDGSEVPTGGQEPDDLLQDAGAAYVFVREGGTWSQEAYLKPDLIHARDRFGRSVSIEGDRLAIGADLEDSKANGVNGDPTNLGHGDTNAGAAYLFRKTDSGWTQETYFKASKSISGTFGSELELQGDLLVVGARTEDGSSTGVNQPENEDSFAAGAVYVFRLADSGWYQEAYVKASNTDAYDLFSQGLALSGTKLVVGAWGEDSASVKAPEGNILGSAGAAYAFEWR